MVSHKPIKTKKKRGRGLILLVIVLFLAIAGYFNRVLLERVVIAATISRGHIFMPPPQLENESWWNSFGEKARFYWDVSALRVGRGATG